MRLLHLHFTGLDNQADGESMIVDSIARLDPAAITHVILKGPSLHQCRLWWQTPLMQRAIANARLAGVGIILGRNLWTAWPNPGWSPEDAVDPAHYARAIATLRAEALQHGAAGTLLDCEPYGVASTRWLKERKDVDQAELADLGRTVRLAVAAAGRVDYAFPTSSVARHPATGDPNGWHWEMGLLCRNRLDSKTYGLTTINQRIPVSVPLWHRHEPAGWGSHVARLPSQGQITPDQADVIYESLKPSFAAGNGTVDHETLRCCWIEPYRADLMYLMGHWSRPQSPAASQGPTLQGGGSLPAVTPADPVTPAEDSA